MEVHEKVAALRNALQSLEVPPPPAEVPTETSLTKESIHVIQLEQAKTEVAKQIAIANPLVIVTLQLKTYYLT